MLSGNKPLPIVNFLDQNGFIQNGHQNLRKFQSTINIEKKKNTLKR